MGIIGAGELIRPPNLPSITPIALMRAIVRLSFGFGEVMVNLP